MYPNRTSSYSNHSDSRPSVPFKPLILAACVSAAMATSAQAAPGHDPLSQGEERMIMDAQTFELSAQTARDSFNDGTTLIFEAYGKNFALELEPNEKLIQNLQSYTPYNAIFYKGKLQGSDDSWARITLREGRYSGAVYDGNELFIIDEYDTVSADIAPWAKSDVQSAQSGSVIYRYSDLVDTAECGTDPSRQNSRRSRYRDLISNLRRSLGVSQPTLDTVAMAAADLQINLRIVADTQYVNSSQGDTEGQVLSQMNVVDGIFSEQVGVQFGIDRIISLSDNGPLTSTNPSTLLNQFRSYVNSDVGNPGLVHLFTGRNLNGNVIGIAYLRAICGSSGVGVTQAGGRGVTGALTAAHEFGHNFGAPHDNQGGSACSSTPGGFLMNPSINGSDQFSQCSLDQIAPVVSRANCLVPAGNPPVPTPTPQPTPTPTPIPNPECVEGALDLRSISPYSSQNSGSARVSENGCSITLTGNAWRITTSSYDIDAETSISFDFTATGNGEIQGVGFDGDRNASDDRIFKLAGSQAWGISGFSYTGNGQAQRITIPVGQYYTGDSLGFVVANDKDSGSQNNVVTVSNVVIEGASQPPAACISLEDVSPFSRVNNGDFSAQGCEISLQGNIWRATNERFNIAPNSVLSFEFEANNSGEIHGIGFDSDNAASGNRVFQLSGSQDWGIRDFRYTQGTQRFEIPVGQYFTGDNMRLILVNDKDNGTADNRTVIRDVKLVTP